ncbi:MAG: TetR/AcrR family transcriptional regulator [Spirochaetia bacterium]|nr:TetR/AcrR family transcriptional regulator [Spirochaetia bacterium]
MKEEFDVKEKILAAAKTEFAEKGYAGARMNAIAEKAAVNKAMLHYYFNSKENLYSFMLQTLFKTDTKIKENEFLSNIKEKLSEWEKLYIAVFFMINVYMEVIDPELHRIMAWEMAEGRKRFSKFAKNFLIPRLEVMESCIQRGVKNGEFKTSNSILVVIDIISLILFYTMNKPLYENTKLYNKLYGKDSKTTLLNFITDHFGKALSIKENSSFSISKDLLHSLQDVLKQIQKKGDEAK